MSEPTPNKLGILAAIRGLTIDELIDQTMKKHHGNVARTADALGVSDSAIYRRLRVRQQAMTARPSSMRADSGEGE